MSPDDAWLLFDEACQRNYGLRGKHFPVTGEFVLEMADESSSWNDQASVVAIAKSLFKFLENEGGFSGSGTASD